MIKSNEVAPRQRTQVRVQYAIPLLGHLLSNVFSLGKGFHVGDYKTIECCSKNKKNTVEKKLVLNL